MSYKLTDIIDIERLQELMSRLSSVTGIPIGIIGTDGTIYVATGWQEICTSFHRQHPITSERCRESDAYILKHLDEAPYAQYRCENGLWDIAFPIRLRGEHLATLYVGQFHFEGDSPDRDFFISQAEECGFNKEEYLQALDKLPVFSREKMQAIVDYYLLFVNQLMDEGINRLERFAAEKALEHRLVTLTSPLDTTSNIQFGDLFNLEEIQSIQDAFAASTGVASIITDTAGKPITRPSNFCHLCNNIIRKTEKGQANCYKSDSNLGSMNIDGPNVQPCMSGGLWDGGASIQIGGHHVANWLIGQVLDESCDMDSMMDYAREIGADEDAYRQALGEVTRMSKEHFAKICKALFLIAGLLSRQAIQNVQQAKYIADIRESQNALRKSEEMYRSIIELAADTIFLLSPQGNIIGANRSATLLTGYPLSELLCMNLASLFSEEELQRIPFRYDLLKEGKTVRNERSLARKDGAAVPIEMNTRMMPDGTYQTFFRDMTEHRIMHAELIKSQKLESLGVLAGGIAHDFNNILTGIMGNVSFAKMILDKSHEAYPPLERADKASRRAADLARQLLVFAKGGQPIKKPVSLQKIVNEAVSLSLSGTNIKCSIDFPLPLHTVKADEGQIYQAFHNIIINAVQAMPGGGNLTVRGENVNLNDDNIGLQAGDYVRLTIADEGCGITEADQKKIYDPYFSTKAGGSGLGLASTHTIIDKHGGHISVNSTVGTGTIFTIHLPSIGKTGADHSSGNDGPIFSHEGSSILVMDDDEMIRDLASLTLSRNGYRVKTCANGDEAISLYKSAKETGTPFSAVIMDLTIPGGMGGVEGAKRLLALDPEARLIVSSGYSDDPVMANYKGYGFCAAIEKPYKAADISQILTEVKGRL